MLGAGIVGVSAALASSGARPTVAIVDRLGEAAGETSFGNAGIVQSEAVFPYVFPRAPGDIARAALNRDPRAHIRYGALPSIAPALWRYFQASTPAGKTADRQGDGAASRGAAAEHRKLAEAAGASALLRRRRLDQGRSAARAAQDMAHAEVEELKPYGVRPPFLDRAALTALEPHVGDAALGGVAFHRAVDDARPQGAGASAMRRCS